jgi:hypothetical protein
MGKNEFNLIRSLLEFKFSDNLIITDEDKKDLDEVINEVKEEITTDNITKLGKNLVNMFDMKDLLKLVYKVSKGKGFEDLLRELGVETDMEPPKTVTEGVISKDMFKWW